MFMWGPVTMPRASLSRFTERFSSKESSRISDDEGSDFDASRGTGAPEAAGCCAGLGASGRESEGAEVDDTAAAAEALCRTLDGESLVVELRELRRSLREASDKQDTLLGSFIDRLVLQASGSIAAVVATAGDGSPSSMEAEVAGARSSSGVVPGLGRHRSLSSGGSQRLPPRRGPVRQTDSSSVASPNSALEVIRSPVSSVNNEHLEDVVHVATQGTSRLGAASVRTKSSRGHAERHPSEHSNGTMLQRASTCSFDQGGNLRVGFNLEGLGAERQRGTKIRTMSNIIKRRTRTISADNSEVFDAGLLNPLIRWMRWTQSIQEPERTGLLFRMVHSQPFDILCMAFIGLNAMFIAHTTDFEMQNLGAPATKTMFYVELTFMIFYLLELTLKLLVHRLYFFCNSDWPWNIFDTAVVAISVLEFLLLVWRPANTAGMNITFMRLLRLCKVAKVLRIFRSVRFLGELRMMIDCVVGSVVNLFWCLVFIGFVLYIFALLLVQVLTQQLSEDATDEVDLGLIRRFFGSTSEAMLTLLMTTTGGLDWNDVYEVIRDRGFLLPVVFISYLLFFVIAAWNIITSRFIEKALKLAQPDIETLALEHTMKDMMDANTLTKLFRDMDVDAASQISLREFRDLMKHPKLRMYLQVRGIDIKDSEVFYAMLRSIVGDVSRVDVETLVNVCLRMRGFATAIDLQTLNFETKCLSKRQNVLFSKLSEQMSRLEELFKGSTDTDEATSGEHFHGKHAASPGSPASPGPAGKLAEGGTCGEGDGGNNQRVLPHPERVVSLDVDSIAEFDRSSGLLML